MPLRIHGFTAERAHRSTGSHNLTGSLGEGAGRANWHSHYHHFILIVGVGVVVAQRVELNDDLSQGSVPTQADGTNAKLHFHVFERVIIDKFNRGPSRNAEGITRNSAQLIKDLVDLLRQRTRLLFLQGQTHQLFACAHLQIERPRPWRANDSNDDTIWPRKLVNTCRHVSILGRSALRRLVPRTAAYRSVTRMSAFR